MSELIIINYLTAALLGVFLTPENINPVTILTANWFPIALLIGILFVVIFYLIGLSSEKAGISITSMATRMSMIFPILVSMLFFESQFSAIKLIKITLALIAILLAIYRKPEKGLNQPITILPIILFFGSGSIDSLVKVAQHNFIPESETKLFSLSLFGISFLISLLLLLKKSKERERFHLNTLFLGVTLGCVNFGSLFFLIKALNNSGIESSIIFGINNLTIVCFSIFLGVAIFNEKLSRLNWIGVIASFICLILLVNF